MYLQLILSVFLSLNLAWTWVYRGGSLPFDIPSILRERFLTLLATPIFMGAAFGVVLDLEHIWWIVGGSLAFFAAQADGWGRQADLGRNDRPDDETGYQIRDIFFKSKSSFWRDLTGLYMRFLQFVPSAILFGIAHPVAAIPALVLFLTTPIVWVAEHKKFIKSNQMPKPFWSHSWVEDIVGFILAISTIASVIIIALF